LIALVRRFGSLNPLDRRLILEAAAVLMFVWMGLRLFHFPTLQRLLDFYATGADRANQYRAERFSSMVTQVAWAVNAAAARVPASTTCLVKALATNSMLRRRGLASELRVGVRECRSGTKPFEAHAWVECDGHVVIGQVDDLQEYAVMSTSA
jgi:hypothetical protein